MGARQKQKFRSTLNFIKNCTLFSSIVSSLFLLAFSACGSPSFLLYFPAVSCLNCASLFFVFGNNRLILESFSQRTRVLCLTFLACHKQDVQLKRPSLIPAETPLPEVNRLPQPQLEFPSVNSPVQDGSLDVEELGVRELDSRFMHLPKLDEQADIEFVVCNGDEPAAEEKEFRRPEQGLHQLTFTRVSDGKEVLDEKEMVHRISQVDHMPHQLSENGLPLPPPQSVRNSFQPKKAFFSHHKKAASHSTQKDFTKVVVIRKDLTMRRAGTSQEADKAEAETSESSRPNPNKSDAQLNVMEVSLMLNMMVNLGLFTMDRRKSLKSIVKIEQQQQKSS